MTRFCSCSNQTRSLANSAASASPWSDYPDGRLAIRYRGLDLPYTTFDKLCQVSQGAIVENKHLGAALGFIREQQRQTPQQRRQKAPRRQGQVNHMFKVG